jgi:hypothetical protein
MKLFSGTILLFVLFAVLQPLNGQDSNLARDLAAEVRSSEDSSGMITFEAVCINPTELDLKLVYRFFFTKVDANNNKSSSSQGGNFEIGPETEKILSTFSVHGDSAGDVAFRLDIYSNGRVVASDEKKKSGRKRKRD